MKKVSLICLLTSLAFSLSAQINYTVNIRYGMNKTNPPSYTFTSDFSDGEAKYYWYFGEESSSTDVTPTCTFRYTKNYVITLKILDKSNVVHYGRLEARFEGVNILTSACKAYFTSSLSAVDATSDTPFRKVTFNNQSTGNIKEYTWSFGDGTTSTELNPVHEYAAYGEYKVCLIIATTDGCKSDYCASVRLTDPAQPVLLSGKGYVKDKSEIASCGLVIALENGAVLMPVIMVPNFLLKEGQYVELVYEILLNVATTCQVGKPAKIHKIAEIPASSVCKAYFTATNDLWSNPAFMKKVVFSNLSTGEIKECKWTFGDGSTSNELRPVHEYPKFGVYNACLNIVTTSGCKSEYCGQVVVDSMSVITCGFDLAIKQKDLSINLFTFYALSKSEIKTWKWNFGDGGTSDAQNPDHLYEKPGTYEVTCTIVTSSGCTATRTTRLTVAEPALPVCPGAMSLLLFDPSGNLTYCNGMAIAELLDVDGKEYVSVKYSWSNGMTGDTARNLCPNKQYMVHAVVPQLCQKNTSFAFLTSPSWKVESSNGKYLFNVITPADSILYRWDFGDGKYAFGNAVEYSYEKEGSYNVTLTAISGNSTAESTQKLAVAASITSIGHIPVADLKAYPNPVKDFLTLDFGKPVTGKLNIEMENVTGQKVLTRSIILNGEHHILLGTTPLPCGIYLLRMISDNQVLSVVKIQKTK